MTTFYTPQFMAGIAGGSHRSALRILPLAFDLHRPRSVIDVGCGPGAWLAACRSLGVDNVVGVDGDYVDRAKLLIPPDRFLAADLPLATPASIRAALPDHHESFDLAISVEVAEHLPPAAAGGFVDLLCSLAPVVLFSAAVPYQGGTNHLNEQFPSFWAAHFRRHDYVPIDALRSKVWSDDSIEWWYRQNVLLFASTDTLASNPRLADARLRTRDNAIDIIHPAHYARVTAWALDGWAHARAKPTH